MDAIQAAMHAAAAAAAQAAAGGAVRHDDGGGRAAMPPAFSAARLVYLATIVPRGTGDEGTCWPPPLASATVELDLDYRSHERATVVVAGSTARGGGGGFAPSPPHVFPLRELVPPAFGWLVHSTLAAPRPMCPYVVRAVYDASDAGGAAAARRPLALRLYAQPSAPVASFRHALTILHAAAAGSGAAAPVPARFDALEVPASTPYTTLADLRLDRALVAALACGDGTSRRGAVGGAGAAPPCRVVLEPHLLSGGSPAAALVAPAAAAAAAALEAALAEHAEATRPVGVAPRDLSPVHAASLRSMLTRRAAALDAGRAASDGGASTPTPVDALVLALRSQLGDVASAGVGQHLPRLRGGVLTAPRGSGWTRVVAAAAALPCAFAPPPPSAAAAAHPSEPAAYPTRSTLIIVRSARELRAWAQLLVGTRAVILDAASSDDDGTEGGGPPPPRRLRPTHLGGGTAWATGGSARRDSDDDWDMESDDENEDDVYMDDGVTTPAAVAERARVAAAAARGGGGLLVSDLRDGVPVVATVEALEEAVSAEAVGAQRDAARAVLVALASRATAASSGGVALAPHGRGVGGGDVEEGEGDAAAASASVASMFALPQSLFAWDGDGADGGNDAQVPIPDVYADAAVVALAAAAPCNVGRVPLPLIAWDTVVWDASGVVPARGALAAAATRIAQLVPRAAWVWTALRAPPLPPAAPPFVPPLDELLALSPLLVKHAAPPLEARTGDAPRPYVGGVRSLLAAARALAGEERPPSSTAAAAADAVDAAALYAAVVGGAAVHVPAPPGAHAGRVTVRACALRSPSRVGALQLHVTPSAIAGGGLPMAPWELQLDAVEAAATERLAAVGVAADALTMAAAGEPLADLGGVALTTVLRQMDTLGDYGAAAEQARDFWAGGDGTLAQRVIRLPANDMMRLAEAAQLETVGGAGGNTDTLLAAAPTCAFVQRVLGDMRADALAAAAATTPPPASGAGIGGGGGGAPSPLSAGGTLNFAQLLAAAAAARVAAAAAPPPPRVTCARCGAARPSRLPMCGHAVCTACFTAARAAAMRVDARNLGGGAAALQAWHRALGVVSHCDVCRALLLEYDWLQLDHDRAAAAAVRAAATAAAAAAATAAASPRGEGSSGASAAGGSDGGGRRKRRSRHGEDDPAAAAAAGAADAPAPLQAPLQAPPKTGRTLRLRVLLRVLASMEASPAPDVAVVMPSSRGARLIASALKAALPPAWRVCDDATSRAGTGAPHVRVFSIAALEGRAPPRAPSTLSAVIVPTAVGVTAGWRGRALLGYVLSGGGGSASLPMFILVDQALQLVRGSNGTARVAAEVAALRSLEGIVALYCGGASPTAPAASSSARGVPLGGTTVPPSHALYDMRFADTAA